MVSPNTYGDLLPFPRLVLVVSAVVQFIFGAVCLFLPGLWHGFFWPPPLHQIPDVAREYAAINYLGTTIAAIYALYQGTGDGAHVYFAFSFPYNAMAIIVALTAAFSTGIPLIMWLYVLLAVLYLPAVALAWVRQSRGRRSREARVS
jgi:Na+-driven multidrug efflux pump